MSEIQGNRIRLEESMNYDGGFTVVVGRQEPGGGFAIMQEMQMPTFMHYPSGSLMPVGMTPSFRMNHETCQAFLDAMWAKGLRPSSGAQSVEPKGQIEAMQDHIKDLRGIVKRVLPPAKTNDQSEGAGVTSW